jgi:hypothetical protein
MVITSPLRIINGSYKQVLKLKSHVEGKKMMCSGKGMKKGGKKLGKKRRSICI